MKFPFISFLIAIIIWLSSVMFFSWVIFKQNEINPAALEVDASIIDELSQAPKIITQNKKLVEKKLSENEISKNSSLKSSNNFKAAEENSKASQAASGKVATVTSRPLPEIPEDLRDEAFNSFAIARFHIASDGSFNVELIQPCSNPRLNQLLLKSLKKWKFSAVESVLDIRVNFKVE